MTKTYIGKMEMNMCLHLVEKSLKDFEIKMGVTVYL